MVCDRHLVGAIYHPARRYILKKILVKRNRSHTVSILVYSHDFN